MAQARLASASGALGKHGEGVARVPQDGEEARDAHIRGRAQSTALGPRVGGY